MTIPTLPTAPDRDDPATFITRADAWVAALPGWTTAANALAVEVDADAATASAAASTASAAASTASAAAISATTAPGTQATSTTSLAVGTGSKSLTIQTGKAYSVGQSVIIADTTMPSTNWMFGQITSYNSGTGALVVDVTQTLGAGTVATWTISIGASPSVTSPALVLLTPSGFTPTAAANLDFLTIFSSTYDNYLIVLEGINCASNDGLRLRLAVAGSVDSGSNYLIGIPVGGATLGSTSAHTLISNTVLAAGIGVSGSVLITNANDTSAKMKNINPATSAQVGATTYSAYDSYCGYIAANAVSGFQLYWTGGSNFAATGKVRVYGYSNT